jgi:methanogenic corrinoid protein MtbC1
MNRVGRDDQRRRAVDDDREDPRVTASDRDTSAIRALRDRAEELFSQHDRPTFVAEMLQAVEAGDVDIPTLYHDVLVPAMEKVGESWQLGRLRIWEEHLASAAVRTVVEALYPRVQALKTAAPAVGKSVLLACPAGEEHDLGLRMLSDVFDVNGWTTYYLGPDTPTVQLVDAAKLLEVDVVVLASVTLFDQLRTRYVLDDLNKSLPEARVVVACSSDVCGNTGLRSEEIFHAREFFGGPHPDPAPATDKDS